MYRPIPRSEIMDALIHVRDLHRRIKPSNDRELRAFERREAVLKDLLSNLKRTKEHPTIKVLRDISNNCLLTSDGTHRLFGYNLGKIREYDLRLNGGRTHIRESYPFERDLLIDLPARLAVHEAFTRDALLRDLVPEWQTDIPIRVLEEQEWEQTGAFYVHIGTEDSLGSSIPPGATALVEPIGSGERLHPDPRGIYLLQFGNGYRCSHCVVTRGKLLLFGTEKTYLGREAFTYPGTVRIAGRIRAFALSLPLPEYHSLYSLPHCRQCADLILPGEHGTRASLFSTEHKRFKRSKEAEQSIRDFLRGEFNAKLSDRNERRYRRLTSSEPHVDALIYLTLVNVARYTDALRTSDAFASDKGRFSLDTLLNATSLEEAWIARRSAHLPTPIEVWEARKKEFVEWSPLLSAKFPQLHLWDNRIVRMAGGCAINALDPSINPGSWLFLETIPLIPDPQNDAKKKGWSRPIYVLRRGLEIFCGYLERDGNQYAVLSNPRQEAKAIFRAEEFSQLSTVGGVVVPV
jgi:hypothetical protein